MLMTKAKYIYTHDMCCIAHVTFVIICDSSCARVNIKGEAQNQREKSMFSSSSSLGISSLSLMANFSHFTLFVSTTLKLTWQEWHLDVHQQSVIF